MRHRLGFIHLCVWLVAVAGAGTRADAFSMMQLPTANPLYGVAWCNGRFIAVGDYGIVQTSGDGVQWLPAVPVSTSDSLEGVACSQAGFVAVGSPGFIMKSPDSVPCPNVRMVSKPSVNKKAIFFINKLLISKFFRN